MSIDISFRFVVIHFIECLCLCPVILSYWLSRFCIEMHCRRFPLSCCFIIFNLILVYQYVVFICLSVLFCPRPSSCRLFVNECLTLSHRRTQNLFHVVIQSCQYKFDESSLDYRNPSCYAILSISILIAFFGCIWTWN
jgi:hypothetical protein